MKKVTVKNIEPLKIKTEGLNVIELIIGSNNIKVLRPTAIGYEMTGAKKALLENLKNYPTYDKLQVQHSVFFGVKEMLHDYSI